MACIYAVPFYCYIIWGVIMNYIHDWATWVDQIPGETGAKELVGVEVEIVLTIFMVVCHLGNWSRVANGGGIKTRHVQEANKSRGSVVGALVCK